MQADPPLEAPAASPAYEPPALTVLGTLREVTLADQPGGSPDFNFNASP